MSEIYDTIIIGGGPAGLTAALYAGRARMKAVMFEKLVHGGQVATTQIVENYPGFAKPVKGPVLIEALVEQVKSYGAEMASGEIKEAKIDGEEKVVVVGDKEYRGRTLIIASGAKPKMLGIPGEEELRGRGVSYCATCDGPLYFGKTVAVIGGGDSACEEGHFLTKFVKKVYLVHRRDELRAVKALQELVLKNEKIEILWDTVPLAVEGENVVKKLKLQNKKTGEEKELEVDGVFFYVGVIPNTEFISFEIEKDKLGFIKTDEGMQTSVPGVFAAGDIRSKVLRQIATAVGDSATAVHMAGKYLLGGCDFTTENTESTEMSLEQEKLTEKIIGCAMEVHRQLGPGLLESAYEECLCRELSLREIRFARQIPVPIEYKGVNLDCGFRIDLVVEGKVVVEIKSVEKLIPIHDAQLLTYLKLSGLKIGLLLNFNEQVLKSGIKRLVN